MGLFVIITVLIITVLSSASSKEACKKRTSVEFDYDDLGKEPKDGWYIPMYDSLGPETLGTIMTGAKETTPSGSKKRCVIAPFSDGFVVINVECECYYEEIKEQDCTCYKPKNLLLSFLPEKGSAKGHITKTDNKSYFVVVLCLNKGAGYVWYVGSNKKELDEKTEKEIRDHLKEEGLRSDLPTNQVAQRFKPNQLKTVACSKIKKDKNGAGGIGIAGFGDAGDFGDIPGFSGDKYGFGFDESTKKEEKDEDE